MPSNLAVALCREYHPTYWDAVHGNPNRNIACGACRTHAARLITAGVIPPVDGLPDCEGWACQSCGADNFVPTGFARTARSNAQYQG